MKHLIFFILVLASCKHTYSQESTLESNIRSIIKDKKATVGVAVIYDGKEILMMNNHYRYPTMSVYKFHLALAVLDHLNRKKLPLSTKVFIKKSDLLPDTHSPLRDDYPNGDMELPISDLLKYTVSKSDNNGCDILFNYIGGTEKVDSYIKKLGIKDIAITATEEVMHRNHENQYLNWTTPYSTTQLLEIFLNENLFAKEYKSFLEQIMIDTTTGADKIKGLIPDNIIVGHKTGSSSRNEFGIKVADNDMGFVILPNGKRYSVAIFVMNAREDDKTIYSTIAQISKTIYDHCAQE